MVSTPLYTTFSPPEVVYVVLTPLFRDFWGWHLKCGVKWYVFPPPGQAVGLWVVIWLFPNPDTGSTVDFLAISQRPRILVQ